MSGAIPVVSAVLGLTTFIALGALQGKWESFPEAIVTDRVVISAPIQVLLAGGDRFLASNFEAIRIAATGSPALVASTDDAGFRVRGHRVVAQLNPCHEDNYYVGNALLSWGGAPDAGSDLLRRAMNCRSWDELPPFFYGFNELFFNRDRAEARRAFEIAAERSTDNAVSFRRMAIMIAADEFDDERLALDYLQREQDRASDPKLREMLEKRVVRLKGLLALRDAQRRFEAARERPLVDPAELLNAGFLDDFPADPLGIGYLFEQGEFKMNKLKTGLESAQ